MLHAVPAVPADNFVCRSCPLRGYGPCGVCPASAVGRLRWLLWGPPAAMIAALALLAYAAWER